MLTGKCFNHTAKACKGFNEHDLMTEEMVQVKYWSADNPPENSWAMTHLTVVIW